MIRIKNIARENRHIKKRKCYIALPNGRRAGLLPGREVTINYETYVMNKHIMILPGEPIKPETCFRVISGVELIMDKSSKKAASKPEVNQVEEKSPDQDQASLTTDNVKPELLDPKPLSQQEDNPGEERVPEMEEPKADHLDIDDLHKLTHKELDALMKKMGIKPPPNANKQQKIDQITELS